MSGQALLWRSLACLALVLCEGAASDSASGQVTGRSRSAPLPDSSRPKRKALPEASRESAGETRSRQDATNPNVDAPENDWWEARRIQFQAVSDKVSDGQLAALEKFVQEQYSRPIPFLIEEERSAIRSFLRYRLGETEHVPVIVAEKLESGVNTFLLVRERQREELEEKFSRWASLSASVSPRDQREIEALLGSTDYPEEGPWSMTEPEKEAIELFFFDRRTKTEVPHTELLPELAKGLEKVRQVLVEKRGHIEQPLADSAARDSDSKSVGPTAPRSKTPELRSSEADEGRTPSGRPTKPLGSKPSPEPRALSDEEVLHRVGGAAAFFAVFVVGYAVWWKWQGVRQGSERAWRAVEAPQTFDDVELHADGSFSIGGISWNQGSSIGRSQIGDYLIDKKAGNNQELTIQHGRETARFIFDGQHWKVFC
jgi:hypothetical protein